MQRTLEDGLAQLNETAQTASDQARDIDALFQSRIRQNYELLSDFILRMGAVAGGRKPLDLNINELPDPLSARRTDSVDDARDEDTRRAERRRPARDRDDAAGAKPETSRAELDNTADRRSDLDDAELDDAADDETNAEPDPVRDSIRDGVEKARKEASWRWRDLLANMDSDAKPSDDAGPANDGKGARRRPRD
jgi:hypothetical protein